MSTRWVYTAMATADDLGVVIDVRLHVELVGQLSRVGEDVVEQGLDGLGRHAVADGVCGQILQHVPVALEHEEASATRRLGGRVGVRQAAAHDAEGEQRR